MADEPAEELKPAEVLKTSDDPDDLVVAAVKLARGDDLGDHQLLRKSLLSAAFLEKLDTPEEYDGPRDDLRLRAVLDELAENRAAPARETLVSLTQSRSYLQRISRIELLIVATTSVRPAPDEVIEFWSKHDDPEDVYVFMIMRAAIENRSEPALKFFEAHVADERYQTDAKVEWLRLLLVPNRPHADVLASCDRMLRSDLPDELKSHVVDATFDYDTKWYTPNDDIVTPRLEMYAGRARLQLRKTADYCLKDLELSDRQREVIETTLDQLRGPAQQDAKDE